MKQLQVVRVDSGDGDMHFILIDIKPSEKNDFAENYDEIEVKRESKSDASKPLILKRTE